MTSGCVLVDAERSKTRTAMTFAAATVRGASQEQKPRRPTDGTVV